MGGSLCPLDMMDLVTYDRDQETKLIEVVHIRIVNFGHLHPCVN